MQNITSKVTAVLLLIGIAFNIVNAQSTEIAKGETNAIIWVSIVVLLCALITYIRVCEQRKIYKEKNTKLEPEIKRNI